MPRPRSASGAVEVVWPGKYGPDGARVEVPARTLGLRVEQVIGGGEAEPTRAPGLLVGGDNLLVMDALMATHAGAIDLVYIDPPFATGHEFERTTRVGADAEGPSCARGPTATAGLAGSPGCCGCWTRGCGGSTGCWRRTAACTCTSTRSSATR
ncbi:hypothetical protein OV079_25330 [Nannocystis pusilla]|uniref:DNA methylase N-4/N-6 domain-containing protein n=1 Tax=Nannocystis pusilla TaxID=889268 RepID=A0A9X3J0A5_9BACT|nr:hypothetical protein [Nannocystis pusilla]MCY1008818.1 hypothetical protein [Nannocystis pusilla]